MEDNRKGTTTVSFRVQNLTIEGTTVEDSQARINDIMSQLEGLGAIVIYTSWPRFEPDSLSVATTVVRTESGPLEVVTRTTVEDYLATTDERFRRFPVKSFWEALTDHAQLAHEGMDARPPLPLDKLDVYDVPDKKRFYTGMEPCECALRGLGAWALDPRSIIRVWDEWKIVKPGRLYMFGARKQEFLGVLANRLRQDLT